LARQAAEAALVAARGRLHAAEQVLAAAQAACGALHCERGRVAEVSSPDETATTAAARAANARVSRMSAHALARLGAYALRLSLEARQRAAVLAQARATYAGALRALRLAELSLQDAYAHSEALERHHAQFLAAAKLAEEREAELEAEEHAQTRWHRSRT